MKKLKFSIFLKLVLLILVFIILVNLSVGFLIRFSSDKPPREFFEKPPHFLHEYVIRELGYPPDTIKAASVSKELDLSMRIDLPEMQWTNDESVPSSDQLKTEDDFPFDRPDFIAHYKDRPYFVSRMDNGYIIFTRNLPKDFINRERAIIMVIIIFTLLAVILYFSLRWIFVPIKFLSEGVERISSGDFTKDIELNRSDELGNLAAAINKMKKSIAGMIKSKESLLVDVSHELRSPLTRLKLAIEFIDDIKIKNRMQDDIREMESMITELLETYKTENSKSGKEITDIVSLISGVISKSESEKIVFNTAFKEKQILVNGFRMEIALRNLLDNAIKYSDGKPVEINLFENGKGNLCISIKDKGRGIDENEIENIFEPFYRIDKSRDKKITGYGLGLSLVKKIISEHGGKIEVKSKTGEGSEFIIFLSYK